LHGRRVDHTTLSKFRTKFRQPLKGLFRQIGQMPMTLGLVRLCEVGFDRTRVKADNARHATRTAKTLEEKLAALDELFEETMAEQDATRMSLDSSQELFRRRSWIAETPFGILKSVMGLRQFLLRGLEKLQTEWTWAVTTFNLGKLVPELARLRADFAKLATTSEI
jgi:hypothetical protein